MKKKKYDKLIRDRIPQILDEKGIEYKTHIAKNKEFKKKLHEKLLEEVNEFLKNPSVEEMADILEVLDSLKKYYKFDVDRIRYQMESKKVNKGSFNGRIILEWVKEK
jgi:predicted house-cleaning noncanonical NTP pyrophosphatase (MazG superfamily)